MTDEHPVDALVAYALGSLEAAERANVEAHVAACAACAAQLQAYEGVVAALPLGLAPVPAPSEAWEAIRASARERRAGRKAQAKPSLAGWLRFARWPAVAAALSQERGSPPGGENQRQTPGESSPG